MDLECFYQNCKGHPKLKCLCKTDPIYSCSSHINEHCQLQGSHKLLPIYKALSPLIKEDFIKKFMDKYSSLAKTKSFLLENSSQLIHKILSETQSLVDTINKQQESILKLCQNAIENSEAVLNEYINYLNIEECRYELDFSSFDTFPVENAIKNLFTLDINRFLKVVHIEDTSEYTKTMIFFEQNSKRMVKLGVIDGAISKVDLDIEDFLGIQPGFCRLPQRRVFYCGGLLSNFYRPIFSCYVIDPSKNIAEKYPDMPKRKYLVGLCTYQNNCVYVFGGSRTFGIVSSSSEKLNLDTKVWESIADLPEASDYNSSAIIKDTILVTGYRIGVFSYIPSTNIYQSLLSTASGSKMLFSEEDSGFLIHNDSIFEYSNNVWEKVAKNDVVPDDPYLLSYPIKHGKWVYFLLSNNYLYRFDLFEKTVEQVVLITF